MPASTADTERVTGWLKSVRFCDGLDVEQLAAIAGQICVRPFVAGETLASAGDEVTEFWIVVEGELETFLIDARGREKWLGTIRQGETVGEIAILEKASTRPLRFSARTHGTLLAAPAALLHEWVSKYPRIMQNLFITLSERFKTVAGVASRNLPIVVLANNASRSRPFIERVEELLDLLPMPRRAFLSRLISIWQPVVSGSVVRTLTLGV